MDETLQELLRKAAAALKDAGAKEVYVFGSAARGELDEWSDVDLVVSGLPPEVFFAMMAEAGDILKRQVDLISLDHGDPFTDYLREKGKLVRVA
ncbi:MAG: nucleotidyltransferase domain-containing protein [Planctomycetota bacterium]